MTKKQQDPDGQEVNDILTAAVMTTLVIIFFVLLATLF